MTSRKRHPTIRTGELPLSDAVPKLPIAPVESVPENRYPPQSDQNPEPYRGATALHGPVMSPSDLGLSTQLDRANALARAREEGEREATIRTMAECIAQAEELSDCFDTERGIVYALRLELHRRFPNDERVRYHLKMRGLT